MKRRAAVLGTGQTHHTTRRTDVSIAGLCREAIDRAMADAGVGWPDIDAVVLGKAPDLFEGVMMPELMLADAIGATGKPLLRVHTAGSVGGSTGLVAATHVQAGVHRRVLAVAFEKQSESNAMWALSIAPPFTMPVHAGAGGYFAPHVRSYIRRSGAPEHVGAMVAVKDRLNGALNPFAHLRQPDITLESVQASQMLWDPIRYDETCPSSDGACAVVIGDEDAAAAAPGPGGLDPRDGDAHRADDVRRPRPREPGRRPHRRGGAVARGRHHRPAGRGRRRGDLRPVLLVRADVAGEPGVRRGRAGLEAHRGRRHRAARAAAGEPVRRGALLKPRSARPACCASPRRRCR
jgi:acetyl-CoA acetyltransferase